jgi:rsbT co-antagonist protein RsbR
MRHQAIHNLKAEELLELYLLTREDLARIRAFGEIAQPKMEAIVERWYAWLKTQAEFDQFFSDPELLERVQDLQRAYWRVFMGGEVDESYVEARYAVGEAHARIGLPLNTYFAGMNGFLEIFVDVVAESRLSADEQSAMSRSLAKLLHLDTAIVVDTYNQIVEDTLTAQSKSLMEMSTPVTQIWGGILLLPIVGLIDSHRARDIMNATLAKIAETQAQIFILDISGVGVVDTAVANNLIKITSATRLMGCECTISGVSPAIAQTIVDLGIDVGRIKTTATMKDALSDAFRRSGMEITGKQRVR